MPLDFREYWGFEGCDVAHNAVGVFTAPKVADGANDAPAFVHFVVVLGVCRHGQGVTPLFI